jgi:hypothetical protein
MYTLFVNGTPPEGKNKLYVCAIHVVGEDPLKPCSGHSCLLHGPCGHTYTTQRGWGRHDSSDVLTIVKGQWGRCSHTS